MTISSETRKAGPFVGNSVTTGFPFAYKVFNTTDVLVVLQVIATGVNTTLVLNTDYSVVLNADQNANPGGTVTYPLIGPPMAATNSLTLGSVIPLLQPTDLPNGGPYFADAVENMGDRAIAIDQQLQEIENRSLRLPITDVGAGTELPPAPQRALMYLAFDASGNPIAGAPVTGSLISVAMQPVTAAATLAAGRTALGVYSTAQTDAGDAAVAAASIAKAFIAAKGDLIGATANDTPAIVSVGANGKILMARSQDPNGVAYVAGLVGTRYGNTYANNGTDNLDIAAGGCMDVTNAYWITTAALTKQSNVAWAVGNAAGMLDTGAVGNSDYYLFAIARSDTGVTDYLSSLSPTAPTMPANYDFKRLIGWFKRVGGVIVAFTTYETEGGGLELLWSSPTLDINLANTLTTARRTDAVKVPLNFSVTAHLNVVINDATAAAAWVYCPDQTDLVPSGTAAPLANIINQTAASTCGVQMRIRTSAAGLIAARGNVATVDLYAVSTMGFTWARRN